MQAEWNGCHGYNFRREENSIKDDDEEEEEEMKGMVEHIGLGRRPRTNE